jgi:hypothetical protein
MKITENPTLQRQRGKRADETCYDERPCIFLKALEFDGLTVSRKSLTVRNNRRNQHLKKYQS